MFKRSHAVNGRSGGAGAGMETWKLAAIVVVCIVLAVIGGLSLDLGSKQSTSSEIDLGFDLPAADMDGQTEAHG